MRVRPDKKLTDGLSRKLDAASATQTVPAVVQLRPGKTGPLEPAVVIDLARHVLDKATEETGEEAKHVEFYGLLETFSFEGTKKLVNAVAKQREVKRLSDDAELELM